jgi:hypothetical protein
VKVLFDNNVPAPLRRHLIGHEVSTARQMGWAELGNGELLREGEGAGFQVMVTGDKTCRINRTSKAAPWPWSCCRQSTGPLLDTRPKRLRLFGGGGSRQAGKFRGAAF